MIPLLELATDDENIGPVDCTRGLLIKLLQIESEANGYSRAMEQELLSLFSFLFVSIFLTDIFE